MADQMAAEIWIGGKIPASLVSSLCAAIAKEYVSLDWGDSPFCPGSADDLFTACREDERNVALLWLCDDQARWGEFEDLEQFLCKHQIAFTRRSEGKYEHEPQVVEYRPKEGRFVLPANNLGHVMVPAHELAAVETALAEAVRLAGSNDKEQACSLAESALRLLQEKLSPMLPALEPFEIVAEQPKEADHGQ